MCNQFSFGEATKISVNFRFAVFIFHFTINVSLLYKIGDDNKIHVFMLTSIDKYTYIKSEMRSFKSNQNIHKKEGGSYYVVSANKASSANESQRKHTAILRISNRQSIQRLI